MEDMKRIIAQNIASLRKRNGMTQLDLAEKLNYSDKAVSKWERGDSIPDIMVLKTMADLFGVTVDYLITDEHEETVTEQEELPPVEEPPKPRHRFPFRVHAVITAMSVMLVWLIATFLFFIFWYTMPSMAGKLLPFVYALPVSAIVWLVLNSIWFNRRRNYLIISLLMWCTLLAIWLTVLAGGFNLWLIFVLGIPGQAIIFAWSGMWAGVKKKIVDVAGAKSQDDTQN